MWINLFISTIEQGLAFGLLALGVFLTFRILDFADLTVEGSFPLGAAVAAKFIFIGVNPFIATLMAFIAGAIGGMITGLINTKLKIAGLLSGILTMTALYSINLRIMGRSNIPLLRKPTIITIVEGWGINSNHISLIIFIVIIIIIKIFIDYFLYTELGMAIRATGNSPEMIESLGVNTDLIKILGIAGKKIRVVYLATDPKYKIIEDAQQKLNFKKKYNLPSKFILFTGGISPRKNIIRLIKVFNKSPQINRDNYLVLTGARGWKNRKELNLIKHNPKIIRLGFVEDKDMATLYNLATLYVYPSLYEGFGLPILEAQACGCPVVCSNVSSIPEVGGDSVHYINPYSKKSIGAGIEKVLAEKSYRKKLVDKGFSNIKRFSWEKTTKEIFNIVEEVWQ